MSENHTDLSKSLSTLQSAQLCILDRLNEWLKIFQGESSNQSELLVPPNPVTRF